VSSHTSTTNILEELIPAVPGGVSEKVHKIGFKQVSAALVDELIFRCDPRYLHEEAEMQLSITSGSESVDYIVRLGNETITAEFGVPQAPWARLNFTVEGLASTLFGRPGITTTALWKHEATRVAESLTRPAEVREILKIQESDIRANNALLTALSPRRPALDQLAYRFGTDKWGIVHWYTPHYERHFGPLADEPVRVLEIGVGGFDDPDAGGASLRMWQQYFRRGIVYGLDLYEKRIPVPRIRTIQGNQASSKFMRSMGEEYGPFDVVIDDGSHLNKDIITSFTSLFPYMSDGGIYVVEDLETSYWPGWGGNTPELAGRTTSVGFLKSLVDGINHGEFSHDAPSSLDENIVALHFYHNIAFVVKGPNTECNAPMPIRSGPPDYWPVPDDEAG
jgi:hypothetical protein